MSVSYTEMRPVEPFGGDMAAVALSPCAQERRAEVAGVRTRMTFTWETRSPVFGLGMSSVQQLCSFSAFRFSHRDMTTEYGYREREAVNSFPCEVLEGCNPLLKYL